MEEYYGSADGSDAGHGGGDISYTMDASSANHSRRRLLPQQFSANAYLGHAFNACASMSPGSTGSAYVDVDPSLLRYTRPRPSSSSSSSNERFWQSLHLQPQLSFTSSSSSSPSPMGRVHTPARRPPTVYCTPGRAAVMDEVLVMNDDLHEHNRLGSASSRRRLNLGSHSTPSAYGGSIEVWNSNIRSGGGSGVFHPLPPVFGSYSPTFPSGGRSYNNNRGGGESGVRRRRMERRRSLGETWPAIEPPQVGLQADASQRNQGNRNYTLPSASTATDVLPAVPPSTTNPATSAAVCDDGLSSEFGEHRNRHSSVPRAPQEAETGPAPRGGTAAKGSAGGAGMLSQPFVVPDVWKRTKEEEEKLFKILNGPIPPPPPPSASTFSWPPTEEEEAEIQRVLYGPGRGRRLPAFQSFCPDD